MAAVNSRGHRLENIDIPLSSQLAGVVAAVIAKVKKPVRPGWDMFRVPLSVDELQIFGAFMEAHGFHVKLPDDPIAGLQNTDILAEVHCALVAPSSLTWPPTKIASGGSASGAAQ